MDDVIFNVFHVQKAKDEHEKGLVSCLQKIRQWKKYRDDYEALQDRLETLPEKLAYDIMVPFGSHAFMPGTMVHTNKITVLLGDNWFTDVSAKQASEIAERRIKQCDKMLEDLEKEKQQFENWLGYISEVTNPQLVDIKEEYDPEKEKLWREQHAKNVQENKRKVAEERKNGLSEEEESVPEVQTMENYFSRFDSDEDDEEDITSSEEEEDVSMENENSENTNSQDFQESTSIDNTKPEETTENKTTVDNAVVEENKNTVTSSTELLQNDNDALYNNDEKRHVRWIDLSEAKSKRITFTHSTIKSNHPKKKHRRRRKSSSTSEVEEEDADPNALLQINSPSDIYKRFNFSMKSSKPKSILKSVPSNSVSNDLPSSFSDSISNDDMPKIINRSDRKKRHSKGNESPEHRDTVHHKGTCRAETSSYTHLKGDRKNETKKHIHKKTDTRNYYTKKDVEEKLTSVQEKRTVPNESVRTDLIPEEISVKESWDHDKRTDVMPLKLGETDNDLKEVKFDSQKASKNELEWERKDVHCTKESTGNHEIDNIVLDLKEPDGIILHDQNLDKAFTGEICEHKISSTVLVDTEAKPRPRSLFKSARSAARM